MELLDWYRNLGKLRKAYHVFKDGAMQTLIADNGCRIYLRKNGEQEILVGLNATEETKWPPIPSEWHDAKAWLGKVPKDNLELPTLWMCGTDLGAVTGKTAKRIFFNFFQKMLVSLG